MQGCRGRVCVCVCVWGVSEGDGQRVGACVRPPRSPSLQAPVATAGLGPVWPGLSLPGRCVACSRGARPAHRGHWGGGTLGQDRTPGGRSGDSARPGPASPVGHPGCGAEPGRGGPLSGARPGGQSGRRAGAACAPCAPALCPAPCAPRPPVRMAAPQPPEEQDFIQAYEEVREKYKGRARHAWPPRPRPLPGWPVPACDRGIRPGEPCSGPRSPLGSPLEPRALALNRTWQTADGQHVGHSVPGLSCRVELAGAAYLPPLITSPKRPVPALLTGTLWAQGEGQSSLGPWPALGGSQRTQPSPAHFSPEVGDTDRPSGSCVSQDSCWRRLQGRLRERGMASNAHADLAPALCKQYIPVPSPGQEQGCLRPFRLSPGWTYCRLEPYCLGVLRRCPGRPVCLGWALQGGPRTVLTPLPGVSHLSPPRVPRWRKLGSSDEGDLVGGPW